MKRVIATSIAFLVLTITLSAADGVWWGSNYMPGNFVYGGDFSFESDYWVNDYIIPSGSYVSGFGLSPQIELMLFKPNIAGVSPMDFGVAIKGRTGIFFRNYGSSVENPFFPVGIAALGTAHFGFKGFNLHFSNFNDTPTSFFGFLSRFDCFMNLGLALDIIKEDSAASSIGFAAATGVNYFVKDNFMLSAGYSYWNGLNGVYIGGSYKIGPSQDVRKVDIKIKKENVDPNPMFGQIYLSQFYAIYWYSFYTGGFYFDDSNYKEGQGTNWKITSSKHKDKLLIERDLLKVNPDGSRWWKIKFASDSDEFVYEFLIDSEYKLLKLRFRDADSGKVSEYITTPEDIKKYSTSEMKKITDFKKYSNGGVSIITDAGTFDAMELEYFDDADGGTNNNYKWWVVPHIPGQLVKFTWRSEKETMTGELVKITTGNKSELDSF